MRATWLRQLIIVGLIAILPAAGEAIYFRDKISWKSPIAASEMVNLEQAKAWSDQAIWVDARPEDEFNQDHVPGAILVNEDKWNELLPHLLEVWSPDKKVVVYCSSLSCNASREVARKLRETVQLKDAKGDNCVFVLEGGWEAWLKGKSSNG